MAERTINRLLIYFLYDNEGIFDNYISYFIEAHKKECSEICVVVNGNLDESSKNKLIKHANKILVRENTGFDSWAYKFALESYGYDKLKEYDEVVLANFTMYGPIYPISEVFNKMSNDNDVDFWGITEHPAVAIKGTDVEPFDHVQSFYIAFKKQILQSPKFSQYWETLQIPTNYYEAIAFHEVRCTKYFTDLGYKYKCYIDTKKYIDKIRGIPYFYYTFQQLKEDRIPFIKRKIFLTKNGPLHHPIEAGIDKILEFVNQNSDYDINLILQNLKRTFFKNYTTSFLIKTYFILLLKQIFMPWHWARYIEKRKTIIQIYNTLKMEK